MKTITPENITTDDVDCLKTAVKKEENKLADALAMYKPTMAERRLAIAIYNAECCQNHTDGSG